MRNAITRLVVGSWFVISAAAVCAEEAPTATGSIDQRAVAILNDAIARDQLVGLSAGVSVDGKIVWSGGAGYADLENEVPATAEMVHRIASISKSMTAVAVMQLVESGALDIEATLEETIGFPNKPWPVRVRQVLGHTSGIRHYNIGGARTMKHYPKLKNAMRVFEDDPLKFEPDTNYGYTTFGYVTLGAVIEAVSGQSYANYMRENVWSPSGMESTRVEMRGEIVPRRARGYALDRDDQIVNARYSDLSMKVPGGGLLSNVGDLLRFAAAFESNRLVSSETRARMLTPAVIDGVSTNYGLGWGVRAESSRGPIHSHSGGQSGTSTLLVVFSQHDVAVALIANREGWGGSGEAAGALADLVIE